MKHLEHFRTDLFTLIGLYQRRGNKEGFRKFGRYCEEAGSGEGQCGRKRTAEGDGMVARERHFLCCGLDIKIPSRQLMTGGDFAPQCH